MKLIGRCEMEEREREEEKVSNKGECLGAGAGIHIREVEKTIKEIVMMMGHLSSGQVIFQGSRRKKKNYSIMKIFVF